MVLGENEQRINKIFKDIFILEKVGYYLRLFLFRREFVQKTLMYYEFQKEVLERQFFFNFNERNIILNILNCCFKFVKEIKEIVEELKVRLFIYNRQWEV